MANQAITLHAEIVDRIFEETLFKTGHLADEATGRDDLIDDELRVECGETKVFLHRDSVNDEVEDLVSKSQAMRLALDFEDASKDID